MGTVYLCIVIFLLCLAVFDLFVGVSNDAVNFLQSAVGAKVASFRTIVIIASGGIILGALLSSGMMDVARHGIMNPQTFSFEEVMTIFLAVMCTDVIILDVFNTFGMPTSTTVSLVFELLGGTFVLALIKVIDKSEPNDFSYYLNSEQALKVIIAIFVSVAIAFIVGLLVMWISRLVFTFNYKKHMKYTIAIFGGIAFTALAYFIFMKGIGASPYISESVRNYINANVEIMMIYTFIGSTILMEIFHLCKINVFSFVVLMGTFALAMAFAGNDLVNFIGVPLAGLSSYQDYIANANGMDPHSFMMNSLQATAKTPPFYLMAAGLIMVIAMVVSKKAHNVIKTSVDLARQEAGEEKFGSSGIARILVRGCQNMGNAVGRVVPVRLALGVSKRFDKNNVELDNGAAFDLVRAAVNLVIAAMLITIGTNLKLPLSTTYVTFMVAMGSSLADKAWGRESAVFRVTGVMSVIGGWFLTAGVAFTACAVVCIIMYYGGFTAKVLFMALATYMLIRSNIVYNKNMKKEKQDSFQLMLRTKDADILNDLLIRHVQKTQSFMTRYTKNEFNRIVDGLNMDMPKELRRANRGLREEREMLRTFRRQELICLRRLPDAMSVQHSTWFHLGVNADKQFIYCLIRILEPIKEHVMNNFNPMPQLYIEEYKPLREKINNMFERVDAMITTGQFADYDAVMSESDNMKLSVADVRDKHTTRMQVQSETSVDQLKISMVYLNLLQESEELVNQLRDQLRSARHFIIK